MGNPGGRVVENSLEAAGHVPFPAIKETQEAFDNPNPPNIRIHYSNLIFIRSTKPFLHNMLITTLRKCLPGKAS